MKKVTCLFAIIILLTDQPSQAQSCSTGKVNPVVAGFLKIIPADDRTLEETKKTSNFLKVNPMQDNG